MIGFADGPIEETEANTPFEREANIQSCEIGVYFRECEMKQFITSIGSTSEYYAVLRKVINQQCHFLID